MALLLFVLDPECGDESVNVTSSPHTPINTSSSSSSSSPSSAGVEKRSVEDGDVFDGCGIGVDSSIYDGRRFRSARHVQEAQLHVLLGNQRVGEDVALDKVLLLQDKTKFFVRV